jgi:site-specific DNA-cytosine methylase
MTFLSLFAGIGGFDLALGRAGMRCVGQVEIDPVCRSILARHFPEVARHDDVRTAIAWWHAQPRPAVELVCAGWPCQDVSQAGRRAGLAGARTGLFFDLARVVGALSPRWLLLENVPGLLNANKGEDFQVVLATLDELGYGVSWRVLDARYFGVAQRRRRVLLVGCRGGVCPFEILFEPQGSQGDPPAGRTSRPDTAATPPAGVGAPRRTGATGPRGEDGRQPVAATLTASYAAGTPRGDGADTLIVHPPPDTPPHPSAEGRTATGPGAQTVPVCTIQGGSGFGDVWLTTSGQTYTLDTSHPHLLALPIPSQPTARPSLDGPASLKARSISENQRGEILTADIAASLATGGGKPGQGYPAVIIHKAAPQGDPEPAGPGPAAPTRQATPAADDVQQAPVLAGALTARSGKGANTSVDDGAMVIHTPHRQLAADIHNQPPAQPCGDDPRSGDDPAPVTVRRLTPRECERLQGFPDDWTALGADGRPISDAARYRAIGNAVAVPVIAWIGRRLLAAGHRHAPPRADEAGPTQPRSLLRMPWRSPVPEPPPPLPVSVWPTAQQPAARQRAGRYLQSSTAHPAKMLPQIARTAIQRYSQPGELVADPMCGIGTTLVEAVHLGRDAVGVEREPRWAELARANLAHATAHGATGTGAVITGDACQLLDLLDPSLHGRVALVVTSPPYGSSVHGQVDARPGRVVKYDNRYAEPGATGRGNLARASDHVLLDAIEQILSACRTLLRPGGLLVLTARPWRRRGLLVDFPGALVRAGDQAGLACFERNVALLVGLAGDRLVGRPSFFQLDRIRKARASGLPLRIIAHEDVLVFRRPASSAGS